MTDFLMPGLIVVGTFLSLLLAGLMFNRARVKRWEQRADKEGQATCRDCGHCGTLSYGLLAGKMVTSANIRLICEACGSENWYVPGGKRDRGTGTRVRQAS